MVSHVNQVQTTFVPLLLLQLETAAWLQPLWLPPLVLQFEAVVQSLVLLWQVQGVLQQA